MINISTKLFSQTRLCWKDATFKIDLLSKTKGFWTLLSKKLVGIVNFGYSKIKSIEYSIQCHIKKFLKRDLTMNMNILKNIIHAVGKIDLFLKLWRLLSLRILIPYCIATNQKFSNVHKFLKIIMSVLSRSECQKAFSYRFWKFYFY